MPLTLVTALVLTVSSPATVTSPSTVSSKPTVTSTAPTAATPCGPQLAARRELARSSYDRGDYLAAARRYQALWSCGHEPRDLLNALQSFHLAGRLAEAIDLWASVGVALPADLRARGQTLIDAARSHTAAVRVTLLVEGAGAPRSAVVSLCRAADSPAAPCLQREVSLADRHAVVELPLDPGAWQARVRWGSETVPVVAALQVGHAPVHTTLTWRIDGPRRRLAATYLGLASVTAATGLGLLVAGWQYDAYQLNTGGSDSSLGRLPLRTSGATIGATGIGLAISGTAMAFAGPGRLRRFGIAGVTVGAALAGAGAGLLAHATSQLPPGLQLHPEDRIGATRCSVAFQCAAGEQLVGGMALGLGSGLLFGGIASLIADRPARRRYSADISASRNFAGIRVRIDF